VFTPGWSQRVAHNKMVLTKLNNFFLLNNENILKL
jgi:hypothetical protein